MCDENGKDREQRTGKIEKGKCCKMERKSLKVEMKRIEWKYCVMK